MEADFLLVEPDQDYVVAGVSFRGEFAWYIMHRDWLFLDDHKWAAAFRAQGYDVGSDEIQGMREGIQVLNEDSAAEFLARIADYRVSPEMLQRTIKSLLGKADEHVWLGHYQPALYVDFDTRKLFSNYSEPASYEEYVPDGWLGSMDDIREIVPVQMRYWLDADGTDLLSF